MKLKEIEAAIILLEAVEIYSKDGYKIIASEHAGERWEERFPDNRSMENFFSNTIELFDRHLQDMKDLASKKDPETGRFIPIPPFIVKSKSLNQSILFAFQPFKKIFTVVTFFEIGRDKPKPGTNVLMIENMNAVMYFEID